jgi:transposase InsO family protein
VTPAGFDSIFVVVDRLSKSVKLIPCHKTDDAEATAQLFFDNVVRHEGLPLNIVSDRDTRFTSKFWAALCNHFGIVRKLSSSFHPQTDGSTERVNRVLEDMLRHYVSPSLTDWDKLLTLVEFAINNSYHESIKTTPFLLTKGRQILTPMDYAIHKGTGRVVQDHSVPSAVKFTHDMQLRLQAARACLLAAQQRQKLCR